MIRFPTTKATLVPWAVATVLYVAVFSIREPKARWTFFGAPTTFWPQALLEAFVLGSFAAILLWQQLRSLYLTARTERRAFAVVCALFVLGYPTLGGLVSLARSDVFWVGLDPARIDWDLAAMCVAAGQYAFLGAVMLSLIWKTDEPGYGPIRLSRETARRTLQKACRTRTLLTAEEREQLMNALADLSKNAVATSARAQIEPDMVLLQKWGTAAGRLHAELNNLAADDIDERRCAAARSDIDQLELEE